MRRAARTRVGLSVALLLVTGPVMAGKVAFMVLLLGCNTAVGSGDGLTLQASLLSLGVDVVIAFPGYLKDELGRAWAKEFWCFATTGHGAGLYECGFWDSNPVSDLPDPLHCPTPTGDLPTIEEAAECAKTDVMGNFGRYPRDELWTIKKIIVDGPGRGERLLPARYGATTTEP